MSPRAKNLFARLVAPLALLWLVLAGSAVATEPTLPTLTGRVVDGAGILSPEAKARIEGKLKAHDDKTGDQVAVATVPSLQGLSVEDYANRLFRAWKLGQAKTNNGVLLLVAPTERKVRIEVGYGLEGALTDALTKVIITTAITPRFKQNDFSGGVEAGIDAILSILSGDAEEWQRRAPLREDSVDPVTVAFWILVIIVLVIVMARMNSGGRRGRGGGIVVIPGSSGGWSGGFSDGGGFSGGGGSSGGGGASGDW